MTGFGAATLEGVSVQARSVNGRFLEVKVRQPFGAEFEARLRKRVSARVGRGRVDVTIALEPGAKQEAEALAWRACLGEVLDEMSLVQADAASKNVELVAVNPLELLEISRRRGNSQGERPDVDEAVLGQAVDAAVTAMLQMRAEEGAALGAVMTGLIDELEAQVEAVMQSLAGEPARLLAARRAALDELLGESDAAKVNPDAVAREVALLIGRGDVREEIDRLASHFSQLRGVLGAPSSTGQGKRLDFLIQELLREVTTMGSKITAHAGSAQLIEAKATIERMREQVQNVE